MTLNWLYVPSFSDLEWDCACQENVEYEQLATFMATIQRLANYSCEREAKNSIQCCGSKDRRSIGHSERRIINGAMYVLLRGWYACVCLIIMEGCMYICVCASNMVVVCVHTYTYIPLSRYHIIEALMMKGNTVTAHSSPRTLSGKVSASWPKC